jgi:hypothetical protein
LAYHGPWADSVRWLLGCFQVATKNTCNWTNTVSLQTVNWIPRPSHPWTMDTNVTVFSLKKKNTAYCRKFH